VKIYNLNVLVEPKKAGRAPAAAGAAAGAAGPGPIIEAISGEIKEQIERDGPENILYAAGSYRGHEVVRPVDAGAFPACLTQNTDRLAFQISLPTKKDLGRRWFLKRLEGEGKKNFRLVATSDVWVIHVEIEA